jgi:hypothetical protein
MLDAWLYEWTSKASLARTRCSELYTREEGGEREEEEGTGGGKAEKTGVMIILPSSRLVYPATESCSTSYWKREEGKEEGEREEGKEEGERSRDGKEEEEKGREDDTPGRSAGKDIDLPGRSKGRRSSSDKAAVARIEPSFEDFIRSCSWLSGSTV